MNKSGIYVIQFKVRPDKFYIGSTTNFSRRKAKHLSDLRRNKHHSPLLQRYYNKYGESGIDIYMWHECSSDIILRYEQMFLDILKPPLNICLMAGNTVGYKHTEEAKRKISESGKGNKYCVNRVPWNKGKHGYKMGPASEERKERARLGNIGKHDKDKHPNWNKHLSQQTRDRISQSNKGKKVSEETKLKISETLKGRKMPDEIKKKISLSLKGKKKNRKK